MMVFFNRKPSTTAMETSSVVVVEEGEEQGGRSVMETKQQEQQDTATTTTTTTRTTTHMNHQRNVSLSGDSAFVEMDPSERFGRFDEELGRGACKIVYKAFDTQEGREVAWNKVDLGAGGGPLGMDREEQDRILAEIRVLKALKHKNIMSFYKWWYNEKKGQVNFISEMFASGTLRRYRKKHKHLGDDVLKHWGWQILSGLVYLHGHKPPIVHRDLKCDNIFINGADGVVKIGDLGLATMLHGRSAPQSVIGTPEFMAPELYDEYYDDRVDVYAFGMVMLELATLEYPYSECANAAQIYRKVTLGVRPSGLQKVTCRELADFINTCIAPLEQRPRSRQLLKHPYFASIRSTLHPSRSELLLSAASSQNPSGHSTFGPKSANGARKESRPPVSSDSNQSFAAVGGSLARSKSESPVPVRLESMAIKHQRSAESELLRELVEKMPTVKSTRMDGGSSSNATSARETPVLASPAPEKDLIGSPFKDQSLVVPNTDPQRKRGRCRCAATNRCFEFAGKYREDKETRLLNLRLKIVEPDETSRTVEFEFDMNSDTATSVASEMVGVLDLSPEDAFAISAAMEAEISTLLSSLEGHASCTVAQAAAELQQELKDTALQHASSIDDTDHSIAMETRPGLGPVAVRPPTMNALSGFDSMASFHSMESAHSMHSSAMQSKTSSPVKGKTLASSEDSMQNGMKHISSAEIFPKVHHVQQVSTTPEGNSRRPSLEERLSPRNGRISPGDGNPNRDKRSLSKLWENLQEVAEERQTLTPPPPSKPPLKPALSKPPGSLSSPPSLNGDPAVQNEVIPSVVDPKQSKDDKRQQAINALKAVELRSLDMLGSSGSANNLRGVPMARQGSLTTNSSKDSFSDSPSATAPTMIDAVNPATIVESINNKLSSTTLEHH
jgi:WNK lysine deficient protein kinase